MGMPPAPQGTLHSFQLCQVVQINLACEKCLQMMDLVPQSELLLNATQPASNQYRCSQCGATVRTSKTQKYPAQMFVPASAAVSDIRALFGSPQQAGPSQQEEDQEVKGE